MATEGFYLGGVIDPADGDRTGEVLDYDPADMTTHGVIVGMTGSGKTGLGVIFLEEALLSQTPTLITDPKGDMTNLLLTFPDLLPDDFEPWVDPTEARRDGKTTAELATEKAELWTRGLGWWDQDGERIRRLKESAGFTIYTPGSTAGIGVNVIGSLENPGLDWQEHAEALRDQIQGFVSGLLGLVGVDTDPISSREHILVSNLIEHAWQQGESLDMTSLLSRVQRPPLRKLGVFDVNTFFPETDRMALAMKLNGLVASPAFAEWMQGSTLDIGRMLWSEDGTPQAAIVYLAHLSDAERQFIVTLLLSKVVTWMRGLGGTSDLRAMVYMDEVFGFVPPTAEPPSKRPILTLLKQARAYGVGLLLSTQNPVDLDYKAMSNAGTWCIGRLQTERDKSRIVEALESASGEVDTASIDELISGLDKRQFLLHNTREPKPTVFTTRWALSYLAGPLTKSQVGDLMEGVHSAVSDLADVVSSAVPVTPNPELAEDETPIMPAIAHGVRVYHLDAGTTWAPLVEASPGASRHEVAIAARVQLVYDDVNAKVNHHEEWEAIFYPLHHAFDPATAVNVDYDDRDFRTDTPVDVTYAVPEAEIATRAYFRSATTALKNHLHGEAHVIVLKNPGLKLSSRIGESEDDFLRRCDQEAESRADTETAKLRDKYAAKLTRAGDQLSSVERRVAELEVDLAGRKESQFLDQAGAVFGVLLGRLSTRSLTGSARSRSAARSAAQRLRSAKARMDDKQTQISRLEDELMTELEEINDRWENLATEIETVEIGLEKNDISISEMVVVWLPVGR